MAVGRTSPAFAYGVDYSVLATPPAIIFFVFLVVLAIRLALRLTRKDKSNGMYIKDISPKGTSKWQ